MRRPLYSALSIPLLSIGLMTASACQESTRDDSPEQTPPTTTQETPVQEAPPATQEESFTTLNELREAIRQARRNNNPSAALILLNENLHLISDREQAWLALTRIELAAEQSQLAEALSAMERFTNEHTLPHYGAMKVAGNLFNRAEANGDTAAMRQAYVIITQTARPRDAAGRSLRRLVEAEGAVVETVTQARNDLNAGTISRHDLAFLAEISRDDQSAHYDADIAIKSYRSILETNPGDGRASSALMNVFISVARLNDAIETYRNSPSSPYGLRRDLNTLSPALVVANRRNDALGLIAELAAITEVSRLFQRDLALVAGLYSKIGALVEAEETLLTRLNLVKAQGDREAITGATIDLALQTAIRDPQEGLSILTDYTNTTEQLTEALHKDLEAARLRIEALKDESERP